ncbi:hypothetical protein [Persephonella sp.]
MKRFLILLFFVAGMAYGNTLILTEGKYSTYIQEEEFMLAEGENVIGPISILPVALVDAVEVIGDNETVRSMIFEKTSSDWKKNILGKYVTIEGEGRIIRGTVISVEGNYITLNTKKGFVVTTLPEFPSRISSPLRWEELFSPQLTLKVNSSEAKSQVLKIRYPVKGVDWRINYIMDIKDGIKQLKGYIVITNNTPVDFRRVDIIIKNRINREFQQVSLPPYTEKKILFTKKNISSPADLSGLPEGKVYVYRNGIFERSTTVRALQR